MIAADWIARRLVRAGIRHVFGVSGANVEDLFAAVRREPGLTAVIAKHELAAGTMADGYCRASGRLAVVMTTSGAGAMNLVPALAEARASGVPLVALVGEPPRELWGWGAFQDTSEAGEVDAQAVLATVSVWCRRATTAADLPALLDESIVAALGPRPGPAVLLVAKGLQRTDLDARCMASVPTSPPVGRVTRQPEAVDAAALATALRLASRGPVVIVAGDAIARGGSTGELAALARTLDAAVAVTPDARDAFDNRDPRFLGVAGAMGHDRVRHAIARAGTVLLAGTLLPVIARQGLEGLLAEKAVIALGGDAPFVPVRLHVRGSVGAVMASLAALASRSRGSSEPEDQPAARPELPMPSDPPADRGVEVDLDRDGALRIRARRRNRISTATVLGSLARALPPRATVLVDAGNCGASAVHHLPAPPDGRWLLATGMAGMGWTFGAAIGAALATGERSWVVAGDGSFFMHGLEIHTAVEHAVPVTWVLVNDSAHGMCVARESLLLGEHSAGSAFRRSHIGAGLAAMFPGLLALDCRRADDLASTLESAARAAGPAVVCVELPAIEVPPFVTFAQALANERSRGDDDEVRRYCEAG